MKSQSDLANDRTFLAWLRTGIALFGLGFVVGKVALIVAPEEDTVSDERLYTGAGVILVLCGAALIALGWWLHASVARDVDEGQVTPVALWPRVITAVAIVGALLLSALIIVTT
ncbi:MAG: DUF202 domain-containing protein [Acidimicrobiia bacterium]